MIIWRTYPTRLSVGSVGCSVKELERSSVSGARMGRLP